MHDAIVVGGGIAGLTCAFQIHQAGLKVMLLESAHQAGGVMRTEDADGYRLELGPNTVQRSTPELESLIRDLDMIGDVLEAAPAAKRRYIVRDGRPVAVPSSPKEMVTTNLLSWRGRLRLASELFRTSRSDPGDESIASFVRRRMGSEALAYTIDPFVSGVHAGDPERLSVQHAFPKVFRLEDQFGSLITGAIRTAAERRAAPTPKWRMFSFKGGIQTLPRTISQKLGSSVRFSAAVTRVRYERDGWCVTYDGETSMSRSLVLAIPLHALSRIDLPPGLYLSEARSVAHPPLSLVYTGFNRSQVAHPLDGFGMLVPSVETRFSILGSLFTSSLFNDRAPKGEVLITSFTGGRRKPDLACLPDSTIIERTTADLRHLLGIEGAPTLSHVRRWKHAIPQYEVGYQQVKDEIAAAEASNRLLFFAGNYRDGVSVPDTVRQATDTAARLIRSLDKHASR